MDKIKQHTYQEIDYNDLEDIINNYYHVKNIYDFVAAVEGNNDSCYTYNDITKKDALKELNLGCAVVYNYKKGDIPVAEMMLQGECPEFGTRDILLELVLNDVIPEGDYLVKVGW